MPHFTPISDGFGRTMTIAGSDPYTTSNIGVYPLVKFLREFNLLGMLKKEVAPSLPILYSSVAVACLNIKNFFNA